jgi:hypothetical protein
MQTLAQLQSGVLKGVVSLKLSEGLTQFPQEIFSLADTLEVLDLSGNQLTALPDDFGRLKKLKILFCSDNPFTVLPEVLADCPLLEMVGFKANQITTVPPKAFNPNLRWLILTNNQITAIPPEIGRCHRMQKLALAGNRLTELPQALSQCRNLGLLRISANRLTQLPGWLLSMPRLAFLAFSGNPFCIRGHAQPLPLIPWHTLQVQQVLGQGASGVIYKSILNSGTQSTQVAVKIYKGAVTSDGLPDDEMDAAIAAGTHPGLVQLIGQITNHPEGKQGLVMGLIPPRFYNLGQPPSYASCTRDVFAPNASLTVGQALNIARTIASVGSQLHRNGILHGDLYAHNTLVDEQGNTLFGDFGAASFYDTSDAGVAFALERIEVCAYGHLLDDLVYLCKETPEHPAIAALTMLRDKCTAEVVSTRPGFDYLCSALMGI